MSIPTGGEGIAVIPHEPLLPVKISQTAVHRTVIIEKARLDQTHGVEVLARERVHDVVNLVRVHGEIMPGNPYRLVPSLEGLPEVLLSLEGNERARKLRVRRRVHDVGMRFRGHRESALSPPASEGIR